MSCSITPVIKVKVGERHTDGERRQASRRTEMQPETVWRCGGAAVSTWRPQTCSPGRNRRSFLYGSSLSPCPSIPSPCLFPLAVVFFLFFSYPPHFIPLQFQPALRLSTPAALDSFYPLKETAAGCCRGGSSAMCSWSKHHTDAPYGRLSCNAQSAAFFACDKKHGDAGAEGEWGPARADSLSCPSCVSPPPTPAPFMWTCFTPNIWFQRWDQPLFRQSTSRKIVYVIAVERNRHNWSRLLQLSPCIW